MVQAVNAQRELRGLQPYEVNAQLRRVARGHSEDMVARGYFSHITPEGVTLWDRLANAGLDPRWAGENIQRNSQTGVEAVDYAIQWFMDSTPHRKNILHQHYTHMGAGVALENVEPGSYTLTTFTLVFAQLPPSDKGQPD